MPLLLGIDMDIKVQIYLRKLRDGGGAVSARVAIAAGIVLTCEKTKLQEYGGPVLLGKAWTHPLLNDVG